MPRIPPAPLFFSSIFLFFPFLFPFSFLPSFPSFPAHARPCSLPTRARVPLLPMRSTSPDARRSARRSAQRRPPLPDLSRHRTTRRSDTTSTLALAVNRARTARAAAAVEPSSHSTHRAAHRQGRPFPAPQLPWTSLPRYAPPPLHGCHLALDAHAAQR